MSALRSMVRAIRLHPKAGAYGSLALAAALLAPVSPAMAEGNTSGKITMIQSYREHVGLLVRLDGNPINPDGCGSSAWYIFPDDSPRAQFVQSGLLTTLHSGKPVYITIRDCLQQYPVIVHVSFAP